MGEGSCHFAMHRYGDALAAYLDARRLAEAAGDRQQLGLLLLSISSLHSQVGDLEAAIQAGEDAWSILRDQPRTGYEAHLHIQLAGLRARQGDLEGAARAFYAGIDAAAQSGDAATQAVGWNDLGYYLLQAGRIAEAERALVEAFRLRLLWRDKDISFSYRNLGMLRLAQGDLRSASVLLDRAAATWSPASSRMPVWTLHHERGQLRLAQGKPAEALAEFRAALDFAERWRLHVLPADSVRSSTEAGLDRIYSSFIETAAALHLRTGRESLAWEALAAAEEHRAASLHALVRASDAWKERLPAEYWETLAKLRAAESALLREDSGAAAGVARLRTTLAQMEARAGLEAPAAGSLRSTRFAARLRGRLASDEAFFAFHLGASQSYAWAVTRDRLRLYPLPPRARIAAMVEGFRSTVLENADEAAVRASGERLYGDLFGAAGAAVRAKHHWILAPDDCLYELPFAALPVTSEESRPAYLAVRHAVRVAPGAGLLDSGSQPPLEGPFVGIGDPIYNAADPRWRGPAAARSPQGGLFRLIPSLLAGPTGTDALAVPRLPGSASEIESCARAWGDAGRFPPVQLIGEAASRGRLAEALKSRPAIVHFATHVLRSSGRLDLPFIALSRRPGAGMDHLGPAEIHSWRLTVGLVVLSGCSSGDARAMPAAMKGGYRVLDGRSGAGLHGLTRAWLAAGASAVCASRWPVPDDRGEFFQSFYRRLRESRGSTGRRAALALRLAQTETLRAGSWRAQPKRWASYFIVGKD